MTLADKRIRSFVSRPGRTTQAQKRALAQNWTRFGLNAAGGMIDLDAAFGRHAPRYLEIGFGMGDTLLEMARGNPELDYLGIEVYEPGLGRLLLRLAEEDVGNVRVLKGDAVVLLETAIPHRSLDGILLYFPDPWPKRRHHKRRIVQPDFVSLVCQRLKPEGRFELATDWGNYAEHMLKILEAEPKLVNTAGPGLFAHRHPPRALTKFERRGQKIGHEIWDLVFVLDATDDQIPC